MKTTITENRAYTFDGKLLAVTFQEELYIRVKYLPTETGLEHCTEMTFFENKPWLKASIVANDGPEMESLCKKILDKVESVT